MMNNWYLEEATRNWSPFWAQAFRSYALWHEKLAVPGFSFLSGYFAKSFSKFDDSARWKRSISMLLVGALQIQVFTKFVAFVVKGSLEGDWNLPTSLEFWDHLETWYLIALFMWRFMTPVLNLFEHPLLLSMAAALLHVHITFGWPAELRMRLFRFFPYYVAGVITDKTMFENIPKPMLTGLVGVTMTLLASMLVQDKDKYLGIAYDIDWDMETHVIFFLQYVFCGIIVVSVILLVRQISVPLFPFSHANSTLAIYVWHWHLMAPLLWGNYPLSDTPFVNQRPLMTWMQSLHPLIGIVLAHLIAYGICILIGSQFVWTILRMISDPDCQWMYRKDKHSKAKETHPNGAFPIEVKAIRFAKEDELLKTI